MPVRRLTVGCVTASPIESGALGTDGRYGTLILRFPLPDVDVNVARTCTDLLELEVPHVA